MFSYFIIGNVTLKSEQTLTSAVYGYTYSKLSMSEINACLYASESKLSKLHLVLQNAYNYVNSPTVLLLSNDTEDMS